MNCKITNTGRFLLIFAITASMLASCAPQSTPAPAPTLDHSTVVAEAVKTISAQMTEEAKNNPSPTPQPTATPLPTQTPVPPTPTEIPFTATPVLPTATFTPVPPAISAKPLYASTYPGNKREYLPNEKFSLALGFMNTGSVAWDEGYSLKLINFTGEVTVQQEGIRLGKTVKPGEKGEFNLWAFGSETITTHTWVFQLYNSGGIPVQGGVISFTYKSITN